MGTCCCRKKTQDEKKEKQSEEEKCKCRCSIRLVCQVVIAALLFALTTAAFIFSKVSLVWLLGGATINNIRLETWYAAIGLVLIVPEAVALLKVFWNTSFIKRTGTHRWPSGIALFVGFLVSFAEVTSFLVFTLEVAPRIPAQVLLPVLSAVFSVSLCHDLWENVKSPKHRPAKIPESPPVASAGGASSLQDVHYDTNFTLHHDRNSHHNDNDKTEDGEVVTTLHKWKRVAKTILGFSGFWATCAISAVVALVTPLPWFQALCLPACLCLLSLCWHPKVQVYIVRSHDGTFMGRWKATCLYTVFKIIILMVGLSIVMVIRLQAHGVLDKSFFFKLWDGLYACRHKEIFYPLIIHFTSSFSGHVLSYISTTLCFPGIGMTLPTVFATPASVAVILYFCSPNFHMLDEVMCYYNGIGIWCACFLAAIVWLAPLILKGHELNKSTSIFMKPYDELFIQPAWNSIFLDQHLCLNYKHDGFEELHPSLLDESSAISRIFICTTMYREADFEMGRLLKSIRKVSQSSKLKNTYLEAHIFLDNGTNETHLTDFASQLISLLESKVGVTARDANAYIAPYGIQLNWKLPGGMPFFIHLKDSVKVKPKKRWSQVMYMSYVLNFRVLRDHSRDKMRDNSMRLLQLRPHSHDDSMFVGYASDKEWEKNMATVNDDALDDDLADSPNLSGPNTSEANTPFFLRGASGRTKSQLTGMLGNTDDQHQHNEHTNGKTGNLMSRLGRTGENYQSDISVNVHGGGGGTTSSSDQGIGNSDGISVSSYHTGDDHDPESSETDPSRYSTMRRIPVPASAGSSNNRDEGWQDYYEGDISSNNENSLTSLKAQRARELLRGSDRERVYVDYKGDRPRLIMSSNTGGDHQGIGGERHPPPPRSKPGSKRHHHHPQHPPRHRHASSTHHHHRGSARKESRGTNTTSIPASPSSAQLLSQAYSNEKSAGASENHQNDDDEGLDNPAFCESDTGTVIVQSRPVPHPGRVTTFNDPLSRSESQIFTISRKTVPSKKSTCKKRIPLDDHTYILATDADMEFDDDSVIDLLNLCNQDRRLGGACGRTHPIGQKSGPLVWYQKFEYAKDFWMIKSAQNVIGSVMCCPGCFSLYRAGAVRDVMANYAGPTDQPFDVFVKDTGEDRWMCTLMMLHGWKLEYTAFCDNTTYCPDTFEEFMKQRRRWVLSDMANMLLVFKNIFKLAQKNDSFSIAYILYMLQMFTIVLLSPASTVVILAGGLDIVYGLPFEIVGSLLGAMILGYALVCIIGGFKAQTRVTFVLMIILGLSMLLVVIGGSVYVVHDMLQNAYEGTLTFQEYYLILLLVAALIYASLIHPKETWVMTHGISYLVGFPAMQILLPIYAICNIVDMSWGTRDQNKSKSPPISCFAKNRKKYHSSLSTKSQLSDGKFKEEAAAVTIDADDEVNMAAVECTTNKFENMSAGGAQQVDEFNFWTRMCGIVLGSDVNRGLEGSQLASGLRTLRNICLLSMLVLNALWLLLLSVLYFNADLNLARLNVYGLIAAAVYGLVLFIQVLGMTIHRAQAIFTRFGRSLFGNDTPVWIYDRKVN